jgi:hypothetical protein
MVSRHITQARLQPLRRIVSTTRGSWRWQDAYALARYQVTRGRDGRLRWTTCDPGGLGKWSMPQLLRNPRVAQLQSGSAHRHALDGATLAEWIALSGLATQVDPATLRIIAARYDRLASRLVRGWPVGAALEATS